MRTLVIDDTRRFDDHGVAVNDTLAYATTSAQGIALLSAEHFDAVWLDYDLAWNNADRYDTGMRVARWLAEHAASFAHLDIAIITDMDTMATALHRVLSAAGLASRITSIGHDWNDRR